jgi:protein ImuB
MTLAHARSLLTGMAVEERLHEPEKIIRSLHRLARWMLQFAPSIAVDEPDGMTLDIDGCAHLFGGEQKHIQAISAALGQWGFRFRMAAAPTVACAWAVARHGKEQIAVVNDIATVLGALPISGLRADAPVVELLNEVGIHRIEQLMAIPRQEIADRFGPSILQRLDAARGLTPETIQPVQPVHRMEVSCVFDGPVTSMESIELALRKLLRELVLKLEEARLGVLILDTRLRRIDLESLHIQSSLAYPSRDFDHLRTLLSPRIERMHPGFGVEEITLFAARTHKLENKQVSFLSETGNPAQLGELIDCLMNRLGANAVTQPTPTKNYLPEQAFAQQPAHAFVAVHSKKTESFTAYAAHRPSVVFEKPSPAQVISLVPDGPPRWIRWKNEGGEVIAGDGPERLMFQWWDSDIAARDYYRVEDEHGRRLWMFRDAESNQWFVHGQWI